VALRIGRAACVRSRDASLAAELPRRGDDASRIIGLVLFVERTDYLTRSGNKAGESIYRKLDGKTSFI
jgi:hypothetical protein